MKIGSKAFVMTALASAIGVFVAGAALRAGRDLDAVQYVHRGFDG